MTGHAIAVRSADFIVIIIRLLWAADRAHRLVDIYKAGE